MARNGPIVRSPVGIGLIGFGGIARQYHVRILERARDVAIRAVADPSPEARGLAEARGLDTVGDAAELLAREDIDAVVVCAENDAHASLAQQVLAAGKHLYLEKPIATSREQAKRVVAAGRQSEAIATVGFNYRFDPVHRRLRDALASGRIGAVRRVRSRFCEPVPDARMPGWKRNRASGGGALLDLGSHQIDLTHWLLGEDLAEVECARIDSRQSEHDHVAYRARTSSGTIIEAELSYREGRRFDWEIEGERGRLLIDRRAGAMKLVESDRATPRRPGSLRGWLRTLPLPIRERTFGLSLSAFLAGVGGAKPELASLEDGQRSLTSVLAIEAASSTLPRRT